MSRHRLLEASLLQTSTWASHRHLIHIGAALVAIFLFVTCDGFIGEVGIKSSAKPSLLGDWTLASVNHNPPSSVQVEAWSITFNPDGTFRYRRSLTGASAGLRVVCHGTWKLTSPGRIEFTVGNNRSRCTLEMRGEELSLH